MCGIADECNTAVLKVGKLKEAEAKRARKQPQKGKDLDEQERQARDRFDKCKAIMSDLFDKYVVRGQAVTSCV